jgi:hypothetical protein
VVSQVSAARIEAVKLDFVTVLALAAFNLKAGTLIATFDGEMLSESILLRSDSVMEVFS